MASYNSYSFKFFLIELAKVLALCNNLVSLNEKIIFPLKNLVPGAIIIMAQGQNLRTEGKNIFLPFNMRSGATAVPLKKL